MTQLNRELEKLESDIRAAVVSGDEFLYSKLNRAKDELTQKMFFAESRNLKSDIEKLSGERQTAIEVRQDLTADLKEAANKVFSARSLVYDLEEAHGRIANQIYFLDEKIRSDGDTIKDLSKRLQTHINTKLESGETNND